MARGAIFMAEEGEGVENLDAVIYPLSLWAPRLASISSGFVFNYFYRR
jgi:hypothetical protein